MPPSDPTTETRLVTYGTLAPGRSNAHELAALNGDWSVGVVHGTLVEEGWGAAEGFPGLVLDPKGPPVEVHLLTSPDLPAHWDRLDLFEGPGYRRVPVAVHTKESTIEAYIYEIMPVGRT